MQTIHRTVDGVEYEIIYLTREDWGANPLQLQVGYQIPDSNFIGWALHHTVFALTDYDRDGFLNGDLDDVKRYMRVLQHARPDLGNEVPYSSVVFRGAHNRQGIICEGRGRNRSGAHTACNNSTRYAWSLAGNFMNEDVSEGMIQAMRWLGGQWTPNASAQTLGHQQFPPCYSSGGYNYNATACPGTGGLAVVHRLQPPFDTLSVPPVTPQPSDEEFVMDGEARNEFNKLNRAVGELANEINWIKEDLKGGSPDGMDPNHTTGGKLLRVWQEVTADQFGNFPQVQDALKSKVLGLINQLRNKGVID